MAETGVSGKHIRLTSFHIHSFVNVDRRCANNQESYVFATTSVLYAMLLEPRGLHKSLSAILVCSVREEGGRWNDAGPSKRTLS